ncbi:hypothetical protein CONLIGDRAFT_483077 [Coniochaeta ligniaria NRRL 30616]|uniref:Uncharacterized protein n=1 Tax=Coniochaeta ligniaria NRRL 30616 TaxID=1408157 RepID=A0A1J7JBS0_9PEZI|nr:hypothetical protein CONLIGDRAFT_483077 [Coniochaeta ligniaria NRRL 30616]
MNCRSVLGGCDIRVACSYIVAPITPQSFRTRLRSRLAYPSISFRRSGSSRTITSNASIASINVAASSRAPTGLVVWMSRGSAFLSGGTKTETLLGLAVVLVIVTMVLLGFFVGGILAGRQARGHFVSCVSMAVLRFAVVTRLLMSFRFAHVRCCFEAGIKITMRNGAGICLTVYSTSMLQKASALAYRLTYEYRLYHRLARCRCSL